MKTKDRAILIVDSRGILGRNNQYDLDRHIEYARRVNDSNKSVQVIVATTNPSFLTVSTFENLVVYPISGNRRFSPNYLFGVIKLVKRLGLRKVLFIAGDPWESAISVLVIRRFCSTNAFCQVQIHADVTASTWVKISNINRIRKAALSLTLHRFESIRVTSHEIKQSLENEYLIPEDRFVVSNIRINVNAKEVPDLSKHRPRSISLVGRLEKDRGLDVFLELIRKISDLKIIVNIAGKGPDGEDFVEKLMSIVGRARVKVWGELNPREMPELWKQTGILVSTAPSESFGRTIREAASYGVPVLGVDSRGFNEFVNFAGVPWVRPLNVDCAVAEIQEIVQELLSVKTSLNVRKKILNEQEDQISKLINCWISLLENDEQFK